MSPSGGARVRNTRAKPCLQVWERGDTSDFNTTTRKGSCYDPPPGLILNSGLQLSHRPLHNKGGWFARRKLWIQGDDAILQGEI